MLQVLGLATLGAVVAAFLYRIERTLMGINEELSAINASLAEAADEIVGKIAQLEAVAAAGEVADPALLAEVRARASALADVVPNAFVVTEGTEGATGGEAPVADGASGETDPVVEG